MWHQHGQKHNFDERDRWDDDGGQQHRPELCQTIRLAHRYSFGCIHHLYGNNWWLLQCADQHFVDGLGLSLALQHPRPLSHSLRAHRSATISFSTFSTRIIMFFV